MIGIVGWWLGAVACGLVVWWPRRPPGRVVRVLAALGWLACIASAWRACAGVFW